MKTELIAYSFDLHKPEQKAAWVAFEAERKTGPHCHGPVFSKWGTFGGTLSKDESGAEFWKSTVDLETVHLFDNQWNSDKGRVFDWFLQTDCAPHAAESSPHGIRRGHYLVQTAEMREIRRNTNGCGYCGKQQPAANGSVFCDKCLSSPYLKEDDLHLVRLRTMDEKKEKRQPLSTAEKTHLLPLWKSAQIMGNVDRVQAAAAKKRIEVAEKYRKAIEAAANERDGFFWLMDRGYNLENVLYYSHSGKFCFGWRGEGFDDSLVAVVLEFISEFPFPYTIKRAGKSDLEGY
jgi:hypothetical protein